MPSATAADSAPRRANWLLVAPYERLLPEPLVAVRRALGIAPPEIAHPGGIIVANYVTAD
jgi:hypothetical protein